MCRILMIRLEYYGNLMKIHITSDVYHISRTLVITQLVL